MHATLYTDLNMRVVAHRGFASKYLENTITALDEAVKVGAEMVEFDVQLTKDGVPIMIHDDNFKRTTGLDLSVFEINKKDLQNHVALKSMSSVEEVMVGFKQIQRLRRLWRLNSSPFYFTDWKNA